MHAIVLAGEKEGSIPVLGRNKAILSVRGKTMVNWVTTALEGSAGIDSITVVGPAPELEPALADVPLNKPVRLVEQGANVFENIWKGAETANGGPEFGPDFQVLCLTCDVPMLKPKEVEHFITTAPMDRADLAFGVCCHDILRPFEPAGGKPGIKFTYVKMRDFAIRHANLFLIRPAGLAAAMIEFVPIVYRLRYQRKISKVIEGAGMVLKYSLFPAALWVYSSVMSASWCYNHGLPRLAQALARPLEQRYAESVASRAIQTPFALHFCLGPGTALDVDNDNSYRAFEQMMPEWEKRQAEIIAVR